MWEPLLEAFGLPGLVIAFLAAANALQYRYSQKLVSQLKSALERRSQDILELTHEYQDLVKDMERAIDLIIKVVRNGR